MNTPLFHLKKRKLSADYFKLKSPWLFNTPDVLPFAYILLGIFISLCVLILLLILLMGTQGKPTANDSNTVNSAVENTEQTENNNLSPIVKNSQMQMDFETRLRQAETQPTYDLKLQALIKLEEEPEIQVSEKEQIQVRKKEYTNKLTAAQKAFVGIENAMEKEHYSAAIKQSEALIAKGKILGVIFTNAQDTLEKSHFRKIDYYLREAQLGKAEKALVEAQKKNLDTEKLKSYSDKIKALKAL